MNNQDLMVVEDGMKTLSLRDVIGQVNLIQEIMRGVMKEGEHYGVIPGCGDKPTLLLPGAQKLSLTFRLRPEFEIKQTDLSCGHREYQVICTLYHIATGQLIGQGVGCCSTMEGKYRYRNASPKCPECRKETIIKGKQEYGGGWLCFAKKGGCGAKWKEGDPIIESQPVGKVEHDNPADYYNCVTPETRILTHDLQWISAGDIETGDMLIGVEEEMTDQYLRNLVIGKAIVYGRKEDIVYELIFDDGRIVRSNGEHKWLVKKVGLKGTEWVSTEEIHHEITAREGRPRHWYIMSLCSPWTEDKTKEAGYLAGLFDADGSLGTSQIQVLFAQQDNIVLARMEAGLESRGYVCTKSKCKTPEQLSCCNSKEQVYQLGIRGGFHEQMRLLGNIRPPRLLDRWLNLIDLSQRRLEGRGSGAGSPARIKKIERIGTEEIVMLGTSCGTYIAEGLVAHNTVLKMGKKRAYVDSIIMATAASDSFTQDIEDMPEIIPQKPFRNENVEPVDVEESIPTSPKKMTQGIDQPKKNPIPIPVTLRFDSSQLITIHNLLAKLEELGEIKEVMYSEYGITTSKDLDIEGKSKLISWLSARLNATIKTGRTNGGKPKAEKASKPIDEINPKDLSDAQKMVFGIPTIFLSPAIKELEIKKAINELTDTECQEINQKANDIATAMDNAKN